MKVNSRNFVSNVVYCPRTGLGLKLLVSENTTQKSRDITTTLSASKSWWLYLCSLL